MLLRIRRPENKSGMRGPGFRGLSNPKTSTSTTTAAANQPTQSDNTPVCSWSGCGKQLTAEYKTCAQCMRASYCGRACQKQHWNLGGHKHACTTPS